MPTDDNSANHRDALMLDRQGLDALIQAMGRGGRQVLGPRVQDGAVLFRPVTQTSDLPVGLQDETAPGRSRLVARGDQALFATTVGPDSLRSHLQRPVETLFATVGSGQTSPRSKGALRIITNEPRREPRAVLGVRPCDLGAVAIQDRVLVGGASVDAHYAAARDDLVLVAARCTRVVDTCFCVSAGGGPGVTDGADLALTEMPAAGGDGFSYLVTVGSDVGAALLATLDAGIAAVAATDDDVARADAAVAAAGAAQQRALPKDVATRLLTRLDSPRFAEVADACLSCANCTLVCPTCFCTTTEDQAALDHDGTTRTKRWESCFNESHSYMHGGAVRPTTADRYRQWLTHKLATWSEQFGTSGCTGCGRCTTWCPVGIDFVKSAHRIVDGDEAGDGT